MQSATLTRKELYELIWSKPMTKVARDFEVSDVWIGKVCREANIPRPPVGYWQKLDAGKKPSRKPLPPAKLLAGDTIYIKSNTSLWNGGYERRSDEEIVNAPEPSPPIFTESMEDFRARIESKIGQIVLPEKLVNIHLMIAKLIKEDERRVTEKSWYREPLYQSPEGKKLLIALNCLYSTWSQLGANPRVSSGRDLTCSVEFSGNHRPFTFQVIPDAVRQARRKLDEPPVYEFAWHYKDQYRDFRKDETYRAYKDITGQLLRSLIIESIVLAEEGMRKSEQWSYNNKLGKKVAAARRIEERRLAEIKRKKIETEQLIASRLEKVDEALGLFDKAEKIRELVKAFDQKYADNPGKMPHYDHWRSWALHYSNTLDPRHWSPNHVEKWIESFKLKDSVAGK